jgi:hypothetical protein
MFRSIYSFASDARWLSVVLKDVAVLDIERLTGRLSVKIVLKHAPSPEQHAARAAVDRSVLARVNRNFERDRPALLAVEFVIQSLAHAACAQVPRTIARRDWNKFLARPFHPVAVPFGGAILHRR